jgi:hypothetical protein
LYLIRTTDVPITGVTTIEEIVETIENRILIVHKARGTLVTTEITGLIARIGVGIEIKVAFIQIEEVHKRTTLTQEEIQLLRE